MQGQDCEHGDLANVFDEPGWSVRANGCSKRSRYKDYFTIASIVNPPWGRVILNQKIEYASSCPVSANCKRV